MRIRDGRTIPSSRCAAPVLDGTPTNKYPDFTVEDDDTGEAFFCAHLGMLDDSGYKRRWEEKKEWYRDNGVSPHEDGAGDNGTLIVTQGDTKGGIESAVINRLIQTSLWRVVLT